MRVVPGVPIHQVGKSPDDPSPQGTLTPEGVILFSGRYTSQSLTLLLNTSNHSLWPRSCMVSYTLIVTITLNKFGTVLTSRPDGHEALLAYAPTLKSVEPDEQIILDFDGLVSLTPGWADEFITSLSKTYGARLRMLPTNNASVEVTLRVLELHLDPPSEVAPTE